MRARVHKATLANSMLSFLLSFCYRSTTVNGNTRCSLACLPRYHAATRQDMALSFLNTPYGFTSRTCYRQHCVYSFHKSYARGYYTTPLVCMLTQHSMSMEDRCMLCGPCTTPCDSRCEQDRRPELQRCSAESLEAAQQDEPEAAGDARGPGSAAGDGDHAVVLGEGRVGRASSKGRKKTLP